jgi:tRNA(Ile)-lysidine synthase TilS/MesJ
MPIEMRNKLEDGKSIQETSRNWRKSECLKIVQSYAENSVSNCYVVTAHHRDDQVETLMLKFLRGVHISNFHAVSIFFLKNSFL